MYHVGGGEAPGPPSPSKKSTWDCSPRARLRLGAGVESLTHMPGVTARRRDELVFTFVCAILRPCHQSTHGLVAMTSASHAEGRQFDPGWVYVIPTSCKTLCVLTTSTTLTQMAFVGSTIEPSLNPARPRCHTAKKLRRGGQRPVHERAEIRSIAGMRATEHPWSSGYDVSLTR